MVIENSAFPASPDLTVVVKLAEPPFVVLPSIILSSKVPAKLPRSVLFVSRATVMIFPIFAKLLPDELVMFSEIIFIGVGITVTVLITFLG